MSDKLPDWVRQATEPTAAEVAGVDPSLPEPLRRAAVYATGPSEVEVQRLVARLEATELATAPGLPSWIAMTTVGILAAAAVVAVMVNRVPDGATVGPEVARATVLQAGEARELSGAATLGPSIDVVGVARLQVAQAGPRGTVVLLQEGSTRWSVDPEGPERDLTVRAGEVDVRVVGTVFEVMRLGGLVVVEVDRGRVEVDGPDGLAVLTAGGRLQLADHRVARAPRPDQDTDLPDQVATGGGVPAPSEASASASAPALAPPSSDPAAAAKAFAAIQDRIDAGDDAHALVRSLQEFLDTHPDSVLADEAEWERLRLKSTVEAPWLVAPEVKTAADTDRDSRRWLDLLELHATLARDGMQDCTTALPSYREVAEHATGRQQAEAEAWRGLCAARLEFVDEATAALTHALQLEVASPLADEVRAALDALSTP